MNELAIRIENVSKRYRIGPRNTHRTMREAMGEATKRSLRCVKALLAEHKITQAENVFWALKNVSFEVEQGEVLGIVGRNGAGKSTLLKILSRITEPTEGRVEGYGRVGSLLEVGTGFHPELTGRENIYLNGAILGMRRAEIRRQFDEIVAFSEIEPFLDTEVKRYSSGMYVRLAFAVAAHLEPEILIIDEVLAVGDAAFQKKCVEKMHDVAKGGRTVIFVSHNLALVQALCTRAVVLNHSTVVHDGSVKDGLTAYLKSLEGASENLLERAVRGGQGEIRLVKIDISAGAPGLPETLTTGGPARFRFYVNPPKRGLSCVFTIYNELGQQITYFDSALQSQLDCVDPESSTAFSCQVDELPLLPGRYRINVAIKRNGEIQDHLEGAAFFNVKADRAYGRSMTNQNGYCNVVLNHRWSKPWKD
jgi:lipopolysaccharide transport system ATP-binding protein